jgi:hypothetical protein
MQLLPLRNETGQVYKWTEILHLVNPQNVQRVRHDPQWDKNLLRFMNGEEFIIEDSLKEFNRKFEEATCSS